MKAFRNDDGAKKANKLLHLQLDSQPEKTALKLVHYQLAFNNNISHILFHKSINNGKYRHKQQLSHPVAIAFIQPAL